MSRDTPPIVIRVSLIMGDLNNGAKNMDVHNPDKMSMFDGGGILQPL